MRNIVQASLSISLVLVLLSLTMILMGHANSAQHDLFHNLTLCDGLPCYLGIVPGKTSWSDAEAIFEDKPGVEFNPDSIILHQPPEFSGSISVYSTLQLTTVDKVVFWMEPPTIDIGSLIVQWGMPCALIYDPSGTLKFFYSSMSVMMYDNQFGASHFLKPTSLLNGIALTNTHDLETSCDRLTFLSPKYGLQLWRDFARYTP